MYEKTISIPVKLDAGSFRAFAIFDVLKRQKRWVSPVLFSIVFLCFSLLCFSRREISGALLLGSVLLVIALGLPAVYFYSFFASIRKEIRQMKLQTPVSVYTIELAGKETGVRFYPQGNREAAESFPWETMFGAYRTKNAIYLYPTPKRALLIPDGLCGCSPEEVWELLKVRLGEGKLHD